MINYYLKSMREKTKKSYYKFTLVLLVFMVLFSCKKASKEVASETVIILSKSNSTEFLAKTGFSDDCIRVFTEILDVPKIQKLADDVAENKSLISFLEKNRNSIKTWRFLSSSNLSNDIKVIKYFDELPKDKFALKTIDNVSSVFDKKSGRLLACVDFDRIVVKIAGNSSEVNDFLNFTKLVPSTTYQINNLLYVTDEFSRISSVKTNLIHYTNFPAKTIGEGYYISEAFGGKLLDINRTSTTQNLFKEVEESWLLSLKRHEKISNVKISPIYVDNTNIPSSYNILYFKGKERIYENIPNKLADDLIFLKGLSNKNGINISNYLDNKFIQKNLDFLKLDFENPTFISLLNKNPELLKGYKEVVDLPSNLRYDVSILNQATNWVNKGKTTELIIDLPRNINKSLLNQKSATGIMYQEEVIVFRGIKFKGVFPDFSERSLYTTTLPNSMFENSNQEVFEYCRNQTKIAFEQDKAKFIAYLKKYNKKMIAEGRNISNGKILNAEEILAKQIKDITNPPASAKGRIYGFTWHHNQQLGKMELVEVGIHDLNRHIGGNKIWGGSITE